MNCSFAEKVYDSLNGFLIHPMESVENAFVDGSFCDRKYSEVYDAYESLLIKLKTKEDDDVETIINSMMEIQRYIGLKMFEYGMKFAK